MVVSPHAGGAHGRLAAAAALAAAGVRVSETRLVSELDPAYPQGERWHALGCVAAVAAGGDGCVGAVATHIAGTRLALGVLPYGTANDAARALGIPMDIVSAARVIADGHTLSVDAGQAVPLPFAPPTPPIAGGAPASGAEAAGSDAKYATVMGTSLTQPMRGAYFLHALTLGLNVEFARLATDVARRARFGAFTYAASAVEAVANLRPVPVTLRLIDPVTPGSRSTVSPTAPSQVMVSQAGGEQVVTCSAVQVAAVNLPVFGGALELRAPDVRSDDSLLDFVVIEALDAAQLQFTVEALVAALGQLAGRFHGVQGATSASASVARAVSEDEAVMALALPGVHRYKARAAILETREPVDITLDGEIELRSPALVRIAPEPLRIFTPVSHGGY